MSFVSYYLHDHPDMVALRAAQADEFADMAERHSLERLEMAKHIRKLETEGQP